MWEWGGVRDGRVGGERDGRVGRRGMDVGVGRRGMDVGRRGAMYHLHCGHLTL